MALITERLALEPATITSAHAVLRLGYHAPAFRGNGSVDFTCPGCGHVLAERVATGTREWPHSDPASGVRWQVVAPNSVWDLRVICPVCGEVSAFPDFDDKHTALVSDVYVFPAGKHTVTAPFDLTAGALVVMAATPQAPVTTGQRFFPLSTFARGTLPAASST